MWGPLPWPEVAGSSCSEDGEGGSAKTVKVDQTAYKIYKMINHTTA